MSFVSYAQNFEDVMLWRALKQVENGFYIDIGAQDPIVDSVSLLFYEHGWRGIHVEPTRQYSDKLKESRPDEVVEQVIIGDSDGSIELYQFRDTGLSTADPKIAEQYLSVGYKAIRMEVPVVSLDALFERYKNKPIHWLKIDVEGMENSVLQSWNVSSSRPWILLIESINSLTQNESHEEWEQLVLDKGYVFAYFDGLNRFYIHSDHIDLLSFLVLPPNCFDDFLLSASHAFCKLAEQKSQQAEARTQQAEARTQQAEARTQQAEARTYSSHNALHAVVNSRSWRITAPLRWVVATPRCALAYLAIPTRIKSLIRTFLAHTILYVRLRPRLNNVALAIVNRLPTLKQRIKRVGNANLQSTPSTPIDLINLTPHARRIYADLKAEIEKNRASR